ncbi:hypothetical protein K488DRAFT_73287 [Vararia minispora EC-137]|uniref:Uncharacterized protein n=1 Tax=Vararia minispora EC-137 TaxID=1314806 RepID=A0ACB8QBI7_9AGAM|nr:hypothetical protein K488DRAFT_73287 [Vararia minispora EC-137]
MALVLILPRLLLSPQAPSLPSHTVRVACEPRRAPGVAPRLGSGRREKAAGLVGLRSRAAAMAGGLGGCVEECAEVLTERRAVCAARCGRDGRKRERSGRRWRADGGPELREVGIGLVGFVGLRRRRIVGLVRLRYEWCVIEFRTA